MCTPTSRCPPRPSGVFVAPRDWKPGRVFDVGRRFVCDCCPYSRVLAAALYHTGERSQGGSITAAADHRFFVLPNFVVIFFSLR